MNVEILRQIAREECCFFGEIERQKDDNIVIADRQTEISGTSRLINLPGNNKTTTIQ